MYKLVADGTVDEKIYSIAERKGQLANAMLGEDGARSDHGAEEEQGSIQNLIRDILAQHLRENKV